MVYSLKGRNVLVTGGSRSVLIHELRPFPHVHRSPSKSNNAIRGLGELVCLRFAAEGCNVAVNYMSSADRASSVAEKVVSDYGVECFTIQGVCSYSLASTQSSRRRGGGRGPTK